MHATGRQSRRTGFSTVTAVLLAILAAPLPAADDQPLRKDTGIGPLSFRAFDPFPSDMEIWTCRGYLRAQADTVHEETLAELLRIRPHRFHQPVPLTSLTPLNDRQVIGRRINKPVFSHLIHVDVFDSLNAMMEAAREAGVALYVQSAYRSASYQNLLWKRQVRIFDSDLSRAAFTVAPPCYSEHATGRAVDFTSNGSAFENTGTYRWLRTNGRRWGWIQSFRDDNGAVRSPHFEGIMVEPWHFHHISLESIFTAGGPGVPNGH